VYYTYTVTAPWPPETSAEVQLRQEGLRASYPLSWNSPKSRSIVSQDVELGIGGEFLKALLKDAVAAGIRAERAANRYRVRFDLTAR
jgi:hypothetical protein